MISGLIHPALVRRKASLLLALALSAAACGKDRGEGSARVLPMRIAPGLIDGSTDSHPLFDRDVATRFSPGEGLAVVVSLDGPTKIVALKAHGTSPYDLTLLDERGASVGAVDLSQGVDDGWNLHRLDMGQRTQALTLSFFAHGEAAAVGDIELWAEEAGVPMAFWPARDFEGESSPPGVDVVSTTSGRLELETAAEVCGSLGFDLPRSPTSYRRSWLRMTIEGVYRPFGLSRSLNAQETIEGVYVEGEEPATFVHRVDPELLVAGRNELHFCLPERVQGRAVLRGAAFIGEVDAGSNFVESATVAPVGGLPTRGAEAILVGEPVVLDGGEELVLAFDRLISLDAFLLAGDDASGWSARCVGADASTLLMATESRGKGIFEITSGGGSCAGVRLSRPEGGTLREVRFFGSGAARRVDFPQIVLASAPEHFGHEAWVEGWARAPSDVGGGALVTIDTENVSGSGSFGKMLARATSPDEPWIVRVAARFADGSTARREFVFAGGPGALPGSRGLEGAFPDGLSDDERAARYGREGQTARGSMRSGEDGSVELGSHVSLGVPGGAMRGNAELTITQLGRGEIPPLDPGMINVTAPFARGYEMLPHGERFHEAVTVTLPYQENLLPDGYTGHDVVTFFFDEEFGRWERLPRLGVEAKEGKVQSATDHFTVMINAIVVTPEHPQASAFDGNRISGLEAASPAAGIELIAPPAANQRGDATLHFPLTLPPGRLGMQPSLAFAYNSSGGNGWLGVGWDLGIPSIEVDSRLGVPRYLPTEESEGYVYAGAQLAPTVSRGEAFEKRRDEDKVFRPRVEGAFDRIVRRGTRPDEFRWEVTSKTGIVHRFGDASSSARDRGKATLRDGKGNIFRWALREIEDPHGNIVRFEYEPRTTAHGTLEGRELVLQSIHYTLDSPSAQGAYQVHFCGDDTRPDPILSGRGGFPQSLGELLHRVEVHASGGGVVTACGATPSKTQIRAYVLDYGKTPFGKSQLLAIRQEGVGGTARSWSKHTFDYFDEVSSGKALQLFEGPEEARITGPVPEMGFNLAGALGGVIPTGMGSQVSMLGGNVSRTAGTHLYLGYSPVSPSKNNSFGVKAGMSFTQSDGRAVLVDVDGDGLPDRVSCFDGTCHYHKNTTRPGEVLSFSSHAQVIPGLRSISREQTFQSNLAPEVHVGGGSFYVNVGSSLTKSLQYLSDVNGDGLVDWVDGSTVYFNRLDERGLPYFVPDSTGTPVPLGKDKARVSADLQEVLDAFQEGTGPVDTLRMWRAKRAGRIRVTGTVERAAGSPGDGFDVSLERIFMGPTGYLTTQLWTSAFDPEGAASASHDVSLNVGKDDFIVFRLHARKKGGDRVAWDPQILYLQNATGVDENGLDILRFVASEDFVLAGRSASLQVPFDGLVRVTGTFAKVETSDDVRVEVRRKRGSREDVVSSQTMAHDSSGRVELSEQLHVQAGDELRVFVAIDSSIDMRKLSVEAAPRLVYLSASDEAGAVVPVLDGAGLPFFDESLPFDMSTYHPVVGSDLGATVWVGASRVVQGTVSGGEGRYSITAKSGGRLVGKTIVDHVNPFLGTPFTLYVAAHDGGRVYFSVNSLDPTVTPAPLTITLGPGQTVQARQTTMTPYADHLPRTYRGWLTMAYRPTQGGFPAPVDGKLLFDGGFPSDTTIERREGDSPEQVVGNNSMEGSKESQRPAMVAVAEPAPCEAPTATDPEQAAFDQANPIVCERIDEPHWVGPEDGIFVTAGGMGTTTIGPDLEALVGDLTGGASGAGRGVVRISSGSNRAVGGGFGQASIGDADSGGVGEQDFLDLNGDGFPDIVTRGDVAFSMPYGGLGETRPVRPGGLRKSSGGMLSFGAGASAPQSKANAGGTQGAQTSRAASGSESTKLDPTFGISVQGSGGSSSTRVELMDINGDGLPDRVSVSDEGHLHVELGLGYGFAPKTLWSKDTALHASSTSELGIGPVASYGKDNLGFGGGVTLSGSVSQVDRPSIPVPVSFDPGSILIDVDGDGLVDIVRPDGNGYKVQFNLGGSFGDEVEIPAPKAVDLASSQTLGQSTGAYFTIGIPVCLPGPCHLIINPGASYSDAVSRPVSAVRDLDGDGRPDLVTSDTPNALKYGRSRIDRTGLLREVRRPLGASFTLDYVRMGNTQDMPQDRWVLSSVTTYDGFEDGLGAATDHQLLQISYEGGRYDRFEREFLGFSTVWVEEFDTTGWDGKPSSELPLVYRRTKQRYHNSGLHDRGLLVERRLEGGDGELFAQTINRYDFLESKTGVTIPPEAIQPHLLRTTESVFPALVEVIERQHEGKESEYVERRTEHDYDRFGNVTIFRDHGGPGPADDIVAQIVYSASEPACARVHVVGVPTRITVTSGATLLRQRIAGLDCPSPLVRSISELLFSGVTAVTDLEYDRKGRLETISYPKNHRGQRYQLSYAYDPFIGAHVSTVTDSFGLRSHADYDFRFGSPTRDIDVHGEEVTITYDAHGRVESVIGPYEQGSRVETITYAYDPNASPPWALTSHHDVGRPDRLEIVRFVDGLGRDLQMKRDGTIATGAGGTRDVMVVSGRVHYDPFGRVVAAWHPRTENLGRQGDFLTGTDSAAPTTFTFDVLDRQRKMTQPPSHRTDPTNVAAVSTEDHRLIDGRGMEGKWFESTIVDAMGAARTLRRDARGRIREVEEHGHAGGMSAITQYVYNPLDELLRVTDAGGNETVVQYDQAGRRTHIANPDAGLTELAYDPAGNLIARTSAALRGRGQRIEYRYDHQRLVAIDHPGTEPDVSYQWGGLAGPARQRGRVVQIDDAAGRVLRDYGPLGEVVSETRILAGRHPTPATGLTTTWSYDTWGRLRQMRYPDGEVLTYGYDSGGLVSSVQGVKLGVTYPYVVGLSYDKFGQRVRLEAGNGIVTNYDYDPATRRLARLEAGDFMRLDYRYDLVGNVVQLLNDIQSPVPANGHGGRVTQSFSYDGLHRLVGATGDWTQPGGKGNRYTLDLGYDRIHNLTRKTQHHAVETPGGAKIVQKETTYDLDYAYNGGRPHAPSRVGPQRFAYDASGRMVIRHQTAGRGAPTRTLLWDSEDRVRAISDGGDAVVDEQGEVIAGRGRTTEFVYDDAGVRVFKRGAQGETAYVNPHFTLRNGTVATKHVYVGTTRVSSKLVPGAAHALPTDTDQVSHFLGRWWQHRSQSGWDHARNVEKNPHYQVVSKVPNPMGLPESNFIYFYHPDHLGSTSFVTDGGGELYEHLQYFPFGELWADERSNTERLPYLFTGKELDQETGFYDFGARYYDPKVSFWLSPDPILGEYLEGANEGIERPINLALYSYARSNPVVYVDPDGQIAFVPILIGGVKVAGWAVTAYSAYQTTKAIASGEKTVGEAVKEEAVGLAIGAATAGAGKIASKGYSAYKAHKAARAGQEGLKLTGIRANRIAGKAGEDFLAQRYGGASQVTMQTSLGRRVVDSFSDGIARESKVGRTSLTARVKDQISKDVELMNTSGTGVIGIEWHFLPGKSGVGPTKPLQQALDNAGIRVVIH